MMGLSLLIWRMLKSSVKAPLPLSEHQGSQLKSLLTYLELEEEKVEILERDFIQARERSEK